jgi:hypothetical protein
MISAQMIIIRLKPDLASLDFDSLDFEMVREIGVGGGMKKDDIDLDPEGFIRE